MLKSARLSAPNRNTRVVPISKSRGPGFVRMIDVDPSCVIVTFLTRRNPESVERLCVQVMTGISTRSDKMTSLLIGDAPMY